MPKVFSFAIIGAGSEILSYFPKVGMLRRTLTAVDTSFRLSRRLNAIAFVALSKLKKQTPSVANQITDRLRLVPRDALFAETVPEEGQLHHGGQ